MSTIDRDELDSYLRLTIISERGSGETFQGQTKYFVESAIVDDLKRQLAEVTRERDGYAKGVEYSARAYAALAIKSDKDLAQAREQLEQVQAEAAAMRENVHEVVKQFRKLEATEGNEPIRCSRIHFGDWADRLLEPPAGR